MPRQHRVLKFHALPLTIGASGHTFAVYTYAYMSKRPPNQVAMAMAVIWVAVAYEALRRWRCVSTSDDKHRHDTSELMAFYGAALLLPHIHYLVMGRGAGGLFFFGISLVLLISGTLKFLRRMPPEHL